MNSTVSTQSYVSPWVYPAVRVANRLLLEQIFFRSIRISGESNLPLQGAAVLAVKHYSRWDPLLLGLLQRPGLRFMTNANQFEGIQGWFLRRVGAFAIDLARPQKSSIRHFIDLLHQDEAVVIFPEGGIVRDQLLRSLKPGLSRLILQAEATASVPLSIPIVPIALRYSPDAQRGATVWVDIAPPFFSKDFAAESVKTQAAQITAHLDRTLRDHLQSLQTIEPER